jgi:hypothetical protein
MAETTRFAKQRPQRRTSTIWQYNEFEGADGGRNRD